MLAALKRIFTRSGSTGEAGEREAEKFLKRQKGFRMIQRNWRDGQEEIDLIALDGEILVFVEVKTRRAGALVPGYYSVNNRKKRALRRASRAYFKTLRKPPHTFRLDVVEVNYGPSGQWEVLHFSNVDW